VASPRPSRSFAWRRASAARGPRSSWRRCPRGATAADKAEAWSQEDHAAELDRRVGLLEVEWLQRLRAALVADPELGEAHDGIAEYYAHRLEEAERRRDAPAIARSEALLRAHGRSERFRRVLAGEGAITLHTTPPHARVKLLRFVEQGRRLVPVPERDLGRAPLDAVSVRHGSFLLEVEAPGHHTVRYPVFVGRGGHWKAVRPGASEVHRLWLPPLGELDEGERYVPAGWFRSGDAGAAEPLPTRSLWVDGFAISRTPVTHAAYLAFLDDLVARGRSEQAARRLPRMRSIDAAPSVRLDGDRHVLVEGEEGWRLDGPVVMVDWHDARAFAAWSSARLGRAYRLPDELEWEKAARGVDGRILPWGDFVEPSFANVLRSRPGDPSIGSVEDFPTDESVYGLRGLAGNVREWMENVWTDEGPTVDEGVLRVEATDPADPRIRSARGGGWYSEAHQVRLANRYAGQPDGRTLVVGFRLARSLGPSGEA
jgi:formylglycine-generating enzyme required for sulfatase activity